MRGASGLSNEQKLDVYGTYKAATAGAPPTAGPSRLNAVAHAKWQAWRRAHDECDGSKEAATRRYLRLADAHAPDATRGAGAAGAAGAAAAPPAVGPSPALQPPVAD